MTEFTASNGIKVSKDIMGGLQYDTSAMLVVLPHSITLAAREFFRHEADKRLGRWRWPENPDYVIYAVDDVLTVIDETDGSHQTFSSVERFRERVSPNNWHRAAAAWLDAHPGPKPWHDAKPWETWLITYDGVEQAVTLDEDLEFRRRGERGSWERITSEEITAGRRIWPEDAS